MNKTNDEYKKVLNEKKELLEKCQKDNSVDSCMKCEKLLECTVRKNYVNAVYESMSHGETGGFEF